jgi:RNA polymerase sigma-70 factor, ECF subfamily
MRSKSDGVSLYQLLLPVVDAALRRVLTARDPEYEDLLQSALEGVFAAVRKDRFRGEASLATWAGRIARNIAIDALRARARERRVFSHPGDTEDVAARTRSVGASPEQLADVREQLARYRDALWSLCPTKAEVVFLHDVLGHQLEEIAATLCISVAATQSRLVRGRKELGDLVESLGERYTDPHMEEQAPPSGARWRAPDGKNIAYESVFPVRSCASPGGASRKTR